MSFLDYVISAYCTNIKGVLHIGAHYGEEEPLFTRMHVANQIFFEPSPDIFDVLSKSTYPAYQLALGNENKQMTMHLDSSGGWSSSILEPHLVHKHYPGIKFDKDVEVNVRRLDDLIIDGLFDPSPFNFMLIDVQSYELEVLKGAEKFINKYVDYIYCEINNIRLYKNGCLFEEITSFLESCNFYLVEAAPFNEHGWSDALYARKNDNLLLLFRQHRTCRIQTRTDC